MLSALFPLCGILLHAAFCPSGASGPLVRAVVDQQQCETTALMAVVHIGAENETRTRDPDLGKVVLYQLSYFRVGLQR